jgi:D-proline reductase (dithiol) PrdB
MRPPTSALAGLRRALVRAGARLFTRHPVMGRLWARWAPLAGEDEVPWVSFRRPLRECVATLVTTGGVHRAGDVPFDMTNPHGDASFRTIPADTDLADLRITHDYYDHRDADRDVNIVFPLGRFRELVDLGVLKGLTRTHWSFMGHITGPLVARLREDAIPRLLARLARERPDFVLLTPA